MFGAAITRPGPKGDILFSGLEFTAPPPR